jgi:hypothetical protein
MPGPDSIDGRGHGESASGQPFPISTSDTVDTTYVTRMLTINVGGDVKVDVKNKDGSITSGVQLLSVPAGSYPWRISRVYATGTTATGFTGTR